MGDYEVYFCVVMLCRWFIAIRFSQTSADFYRSTRLRDSEYRALICSVCSLVNSAVTKSDSIALNDTMMNWKGFGRFRVRYRNFSCRDAGKSRKSIQDVRCFFIDVSILLRMYN
jgi:hypothetical protein